MTPAKTYNYNGPYHDDRKGLGYGQIQNKFHKPRKSAAAYPYMIDDFDDEGFDDEESVLAIKQKNPDLYVTDFGAAAGTDPFYFAAGNVKLSDAYFRTEALIEEMKTFSDSMSPAPHKYKGKGPGLGRASGSSFPSGVGSYKRTGSRRGFSSAPPLPKIVAKKEYKAEIDPEEIVRKLIDLAKQEK